MANISSTQVKVFPVSTNRESDAASRLLYEHNIANIIRQISDSKNGFIISGPSTYNVSEGLKETLELCLYGYYIKILPGTKIVGEDAKKNIVAGLKLTAINGSNDDIIYQLDGQDDAGGEDDPLVSVFQPLVIYSYTDVDLNSLKKENFIETADDSNNITVYLPIFEKDSGTENYELSMDSLHKFESSSIKIVRIDGKR